jgi:hypothetical protein
MKTCGRTTISSNVGSNRAVAALSSCHYSLSSEPLTEPVAASLDLTVLE